MNTPNQTHQQPQPIQLAYQDNENFIDGYAARSMHQVNLNKTNIDANYFFVRTASNNIYQLLHKTNAKDQLSDIVNNNKETLSTILSNTQSDRLLYNPKTKRLTEVQNDHLEVNKIFEYAKGAQTSEVKEIVWVTDRKQSQLFRSNIHNDFNDINKRFPSTARRWLGLHGLRGVKAKKLSWLDLNDEQQVCGMDINRRQCFYIKTHAWSLYKIVRNSYVWLQHLGMRIEMNMQKHILNNSNADWLIYNPQTGKLVEIQNNFVEQNMPFEYATWFITDSVKDIIGVYSGWNHEGKILNINNEYTALRKQRMNRL